jgi:hypothetical protein
MHALHTSAHKCGSAWRSTDTRTDAFIAPASFCHAVRCCVPCHSSAAQRHRGSRQKARLPAYTCAVHAHAQHATRLAGARRSPRARLAAARRGRRRMEAARACRLQRAARQSAGKCVGSPGALHEHPQSARGTRALGCRASAQLLQVAPGAVSDGKAFKPRQLRQRTASSDWPSSGKKPKSSITVCARVESTAQAQNACAERHCHG